MHRFMTSLMSMASKRRKRRRLAKRFRLGVLFGEGLFYIGNTRMSGA